MAIKIETPPALRGTSDQQLQQVYAFLFRLSENLNVALNEFGTADKAEKKTAADIVSGKGDTGSDKDDDGYDDLRALIIATADVIRSEMDVVETTMSSRYEAISGQWGIYKETIQTTITETAESIIASYDYDAKIEGVMEYIRNTSGYIKQGFIDYDAEGTPILGIAIGQDLQYVDEATGQLNAMQSCAFYTSQKVSFRVDGQEVAYVSNSKLYIHNMEVTGAVTMRDWLLQTNNGFVIKWVGGES